MVAEHMSGINVNQLEGWLEKVRSRAFLFCQAQATDETFVLCSLGFKGQKIYKPCTTLTKHIPLGKADQK